MARRLHLLFAALLVLLALTPGAAAADAQDRVGASSSAAPTCTPANTDESSYTRPGSKLRSAGIAAGCFVATKGADDVAGAGARAGGAPARRFVSTPRGTTFDVPGGWASLTADNGRGIVYQRPGAVGNAGSIRIMEPTQRYPVGYFRYFNGRGQPLDVNGKPGRPSATHILEKYIGQIPAWPTR
jgi:hypothetical protein